MIIFTAKKKSLLLAMILGLFSSGIFAQTVTVVTTPTFCEGDGKAAFTVRNAKVGATLDFILYKLPDTSNPYRTPISQVEATAATVMHTEDFLQQGRYTVQVVQNFEGEITNLIPVDFNVGNNFVSIPTANITITPKLVCGDKSVLTVNTGTTGRPVRYELRDLTGAVIYPFQDSPTFTEPVASGTYRVAVEDACGNVVTKDVPVNPLIATVRPSNASLFVSGNLTSCNGFSFTQSITGDRGGSSSPSYIHDYQYPVEVYMKATKTATGEVIYEETRVVSNFTERQIPVHVGNVNPGDALNYTVTTTDACGKVETLQSNSTYQPDYNFSSIHGNCGNKYFKIGNFKYFYKGAETTVTFDNHPDDFKPWEYNDDFADGEYSHTYTSLEEAYTSGTEIAFGSASHPVPFGNYTVTVTNECGVSKTRTLTITPTTIPTLNQASNPDCEEGWYNIGFYYGNTTEVVKVIVTEAPQAFIDSYGPLPFDASAYIFESNGRMAFKMRVPEGDYTFLVTNSCGEEITRTMPLRSKVELTSSNVSYTRYCGSYFTVAASATMTSSNNASNSYYLQKWYPEKNAWGHPTTAVTGDVPIRNESCMKFSTNTPFYVSGDFRVITFPVLSRFVGGTNNNTDTECPNIWFELDRFTIPEGSIALNDYYTIGCEYGTYNLLIDATGVGDLKYEIISKDGQAFPVNNGNDPVFTGLAPGEYTVRITDSKCGDALTANLKLITNKLPVIKSQELCEGNDGRLYVNGASFLTVEWYKNGTPTGITGHYYPFAPYDAEADKGLYEARLSYPSNSNWCSSDGNTTISFDLKPSITNDAHAGTGKTVTIARSDFDDGLVNLFDYLEGEYDKHGEWMDMNDTGFLFGNMWYVKNMPGGTYQFKYAVEGTCTAYDETIVTITLIGSNYWHGTIDTDWAKTGNWTANYVPGEGEDIEFATAANNGALGGGNGQGPAKNHLLLDQDRIIGDLINDSDKDLWVTTDNQLVVNGEVKDGNPSAGTIRVKADPENKETNGTLIFANPESNSNVQAIVEFYNKAYECDNCGFYRNQWQYFGIPVQQAAFPATGNETVNQWSEPTNGNKWITPASPMQKFKGYQITHNATIPPSHIYDFKGTLNVGNALVTLSKTPMVNYSGANLVGNSFTAAIPINSEALQFSTEIGDKTVYLFNTGTRDQWRKLNGGTADGLAAGQYLAVPINLAGQVDLPNMIPSTHSFMVFADPATMLTIDYKKLVKNELINDATGNKIATRSASIPAPAGKTSTVQPLPFVRIDIIGTASADRIWIFNKQGTTHGFDSGWDGRKMEEDGIAQLYVSASDNSKLQVATVPDIHNTSVGFVADADGKYTLEFSLSEQLKNAEVYLYDEVTKTRERIHNGVSYTFETKKGETANRFRLLNETPLSQLSPDEELINVTTTADGKIIITNRSKNDCSAFISGIEAPQERIEVKAGGEKTIDSLSKGIYVVRLQNAEITDARRVIIE